MAMGMLFKGTVQSLYVARDPGSLVSSRVSKIKFILGHGIQGDKHAGARLMDVREGDLEWFGFTRGMEIANHRQFSAASEEELEDIRQKMSLESSVPPECLGLNMVFVGIPNLTRLPIGTKLFFRQADEKRRMATLVVWGENIPCIHPGEEIQERFPDIPDLAKRFPKAAMGRRGIVGSVYSSGVVHEGDEVLAILPPVRVRGL